MLAKLKWLLFSGAFVLGVACGVILVSTFQQVSPARAAQSSSTHEASATHKMKGGGTAVLMADGCIFDLTLSSGWVKSGTSPVPAEKIAIVLDSHRLVETNGTGWVLTDKGWQSHPFTE